MSSTMKRIVTVIPALVALGLAVGLLVLPGLRAAGNKVEVSKLPPPAARSGLVFDKDIKPLLDKSCAKCHGAEKPKGKYVVLTREAAIKGGREGAAVIPGKSAESPMIHYVADLVLDMEMPPKDMRDQFPALAKDQVALLRAWIDQGAK
jgi:hypothetical protein